MAAEPLEARFLPLDGLRAIAAGSVALYHFQQRVPSLDAMLPRSISHALQHGNLGVQVFFVLSGFAISRSWSTGRVDARVDVRSLGRYMVRRAIRLDPPYFVTVLIVAMFALIHPAAWPVPPTPTLLVAHFFYLQGVLGLPHLQGVFWTLCIEIQLYLAFGLFLGLTQRLKIIAPKLTGEFTLLVALSAGIVAAFTWRMPIGTPLGSRYFLPFWPLFCLGVLAERAFRPKGGWYCLTLLGLGLLCADIFHPQLECRFGRPRCCGIGRKMAKTRPNVVEWCPHHARSAILQLLPSPCTCRRDGIRRNSTVGGFRAVG